MQWDRLEGISDVHEVPDMMKGARIRVSRKQKRGIMKSGASLR